MDTRERVTENLKAFGLDTDIKPITMKHLEKLDEVLTQLTQVQEDAIQDIKDNKISINRVSKDAGIARQTFYNNPILVAYVEKYIAERGVESPYETIDYLREEVRRRDKQIEGLVQRDATVSKYKAENKALKEEITSLQATIKSQEELIKRLRAGNLSLR